MAHSFLLFEHRDVAGEKRRGVLRAFFRSQLEGPWENELRAAQRETMLGRTLVLVWIAIFGMPTTCLVYVAALAPHRLVPAIWMSAIAVALVLLLNVLVKRHLLDRHYHLGMVLMVGLVFGPLASGIIELTRDSTGDFFFAFFMIYFSFTALYPAELEWVLVTSGVVISSLVLSRLGRPEGIVFDGKLVSSLIYLAEMTFMATIMNRVVYQLFFDEKRSKLELARANESLRELDKAKSSFFHNISHEIRTPLTLILTPLSQILRTHDGKLPKSVLDGLEGVRGNANRLLKMVNSLLDFAKLEAGQATVTVTEVPLDDLVRYVAGLFEATAAEKGVQLTTRISTPGLKAHTDLDKLEKIVINLVSNALKFTRSGGSITIALDRKGESFTLCVEDTGVGIPRADLPSIFGRFTQLENASSASVRGTGIGLSMVQEYTKLLAGDIQVESTVGVGSKFTVTLPIAGPRGARRSSDPASVARDDDALATADVVVERARPTRALERKGEGRARILVVDDNPALVALVASILEENYDLYLASNGREALERLASDPVDLVISDVMMPEITGLDLVSRIREDERFRHLPVILLTARGGSAQKVEGLDVGADDYIGKPFDPQELEARVRNLFALRQTTKALAEKSAALEAALEKLKDEELKVIESEKLRTLGDLAAGMFHELHNYMNIICNGALPIQEGVNDIVKALEEKKVDIDGIEPAELNELTAMVVDAATAARAVTAELKGYAYHEHGARKTVDLNSVVRSTARMFGRRDGADLALDLSPDPVVVDAVPTRLTQVFTNLVKNGFEAMGWRGTVAISTRREGANVVATVTDSGPGVPAAQRAKLFQPFQTTKKQGEGLGLGLSLARKVMTDLGGDLSLDADHPGGARFVVRLPVHRDHGNAA
jgi:signal transduction histidine kinase